jgi:UMF1 family MFS transporter
MVLGAIQSLSAPLTQNYYQKQRIMLRISAFFDVTEKIAIVVGTFVFGLVAEITNSMKFIFILSIFFLGYSISFIERQKK